MFLKVVGILLVMGIAVWGGHSYFSKRSDCEKRISYHPTDNSAYGTGAYYAWLPKFSLDTIGRKFATRDEAMSACMGA